MSGQCISCGSSIPPTASVCAECGSDQNKLKNWLRYGASVVGFFVVVCTGGAYIVSQAPEIRKMLWWNDGVYVVSFAQHRDITVINTGDGDIVLSHVAIGTAGGATHTFLINKVAKPGEVLVHNPAPDVTSRVMSYSAVTDLPEAEWKEAIQRAGDPHNARACRVYVVLHKNNPLYGMYRDYLKDGFRSFDASAELHFVSMKSKRTLTQTIPVVGILMGRESPECPRAGLFQVRPIIR